MFSENKQPVFKKKGLSNKIVLNLGGTNLLSDLKYKIKLFWMQDSLGIGQMKFATKMVNLKHNQCDNGALYICIKNFWREIWIKNIWFFANRKFTKKTRKIIGCIADQPNSDCLTKLLCIIFEVIRSVSCMFWDWGYDDIYNWQTIGVGFYLFTGWFSKISRLFISYMHIKVTNINITK